MTVGTLGQLLDRLLEEKEGSEGFWPVSYTHLTLPTTERV